jgi:hypothetical protein
MHGESGVMAGPGRQWSIEYSTVYLTLHETTAAHNNTAAVAGEDACFTM